MILTFKRRNDEIKEMSVADGLKALLIEYGFITERLIRISPSDLACILDKEGYVAKIIKNAAKELHQRNMMPE
jgi:hypothetical protein